MKSYSNYTDINNIEPFILGTFQLVLQGDRLLFRAEANNEEQYSATWDIASLRVVIENIFDEKIKENKLLKEELDKVRYDLKSLTSKICNSLEKKI